MLNTNAALVTPRGGGGPGEALSLAHLDSGFRGNGGHSGDFGTLIFWPSLTEFYFPELCKIGSIQKILAENKFLLVSIIIDIRSV